MSEKTTPLLLALDTATQCCSVALTRGGIQDGEMVGAMHLNGNVTHSRRLLACVDRLMTDCQVDWQGLDGIAVGLGPGSFTGLRIGMATAKGLAAGSGLPLVGVSTLDALVLPLSEEGLVCAMQDARKKEVYSCMYRRNGADDPHPFVRLGERVALSPQALCSTVTEPVCFVGDGAMVYRELLQGQLGELARFAPAQHHSVNSVAIGLLAAENVRRGDLLDTAEASPLYIRASDAELSLVKKQKKE